MQGSIRTAELLRAFAIAGDLAFGFQLEDSIRTCYLAMRLADVLHLSDEEKTAVFYTALLKDAGCTCFTSQISSLLLTDEIAARKDLVLYGAADSEQSFAAWAEERVAMDLPASQRPAHIAHVGKELPTMVLEAYQASCEVATRIAARFGLPSGVQRGVTTIFENWDGRGFPDHLSGEEIPLPGRVVGLSFFALPVYRRSGRLGVIEFARNQRGRALDPDVTDAFLDLASAEDFWNELDRASLWDDVLHVEPASALLWTDEASLDDLSLALADFIDLKSPFAASHSRRIARIAEQLAALLGCSREEQAQIRRAALAHDLGIVGIPSYVLNKPLQALTFADQELMRLHAYYGERILSLVPMTAALAPLVGGHHERMDGAGFHRGLRGRDIPQGARIIAVANRIDELTHDSPGEAALDLPAALEQVNAEAGSILDPEIVAVVQRALGLTPPAKRVQDERPAGLTDREIEVLRLASKGLTRRQIGERLSITENTVRHHLEHIYGKTGTTTRVAATLFAMENDLIV
jgi:HD-GYP domain-containing protein (c-di-GMP phosphodiesterase class II)